MPGPLPGVRFRGDRRTLVARVSVNGHRVTHTLVRCASPVPTAEEIAEAQGILGRMLVRAGRVGVQPPAPSPGAVRTLADAIAAYEAYQGHNPRCSEEHLQTVKMHLRYLSEFSFEGVPLGTFLISELEPMHLQAYLDTQLAAGWAAGYVRHAAVHAKAVMRYCRRARLAESNPWDIVSPPEGKHKESIALPRAAIENLLGAATGRGRDILTLLYETACRPNELARATAADVRVDRIILAEHKTRRRTGKPRVIFLSQRAQEIVKRIVRQTTSVAGSTTPLFPNARGGILDRVAFGRMMKRAIANIPAGDRAAFKGVTPYTLRHSRASHLIESGTDHKAVADILGDMPTTVLNRYIHPTPEHIAKALERPKEPAVLRVIFRHSSSTHWQAAVDIARGSAAHVATDMGRGRERHEAAFTIAQRAAAGQLLDIVGAWKGTEVFLQDVPLLSLSFPMLACFLASPLAGPARAAYCRGTFISPDDYAPPCRRLHSSSALVHWLFHFGERVDARHFRLDRERIRASFEDEIARIGLAACPHFDAAAVRAWLDALPEVVEIGDDGPAGLA